MICCYRSFPSNFSWFFSLFLLSCPQCVHHRLIVLSLHRLSTLFPSYSLSILSQSVSSSTLWKKDQPCHGSHIRLLIEFVPLPSPMFRGLSSCKSDSPSSFSHLICRAVETFCVPPTSFENNLAVFWKLYSEIIWIIFIFQSQTYWSWWWRQGKCIDRVTPKA